ncbi:S-adenosyl-L-methionine-dependent methyltransferase [Xylariaceae sp. FL0255]|nr:S-adenosyl-L-methionine-dependent methyltransferase [Xylariaceae sp. FL0255]
MESAPKSNRPSTYWRSRDRNFRSSARLHMQHTIIQNTLGFMLEKHVKQSILSAPHIPLKVADLACGNGKWLLDLRDELASQGISAELDGYDINSTVFPAPAFLPDSVRFRKVDVLSKPLPQELIGAYDIVHVRALVTVIYNANTTPLLSNILAMLKPGGWLQWEEIRVDFIAEPATPDLPTSACDTLIGFVSASLKARGVSLDFVHELDQDLTKNGFEDAHLLRSDLRKLDYRAWTDDVLLILEEIGQNFPSKVDEPQAPFTREFWAETFDNAVTETESGVALHSGPIYTVVGRKPL